jgi:hypothetical protein
MHTLEWLLLAYLLAFFPVWELIHARSVREQLKADPTRKVPLYRTICVQLWLPTTLLLALLWTGSLSVSGIPVLVPLGVAQGIALLGLLALIVYFGLGLRRVVHDADTRRQTADALRDQAWALPVNRREAAWFIGPVSVSAGICEELLFRAYLIPWLDQALPLWGAVLVSSMLFGLLHAYQGYAGVLKTAAVGLVLALIFLVTGSILVPVVLHIVVDAYAGALSWIAFRDDDEARSTRLGPVTTFVRKGS